MKKQLVLGASGFLGTSLCELLASEGVDAASRVSGPAERLHHFDIQNLEQIPQDYTHVYHLAAEIPYGSMEVISRSMVEANVGLTERVVQHFPRSRIIFASSVSVYGTPCRDCIDESHPFNQPSAYAMTKLAAETVVSSASDYCILRLPSLYGVGMKQPTFIPRILEQARNHGTIRVFGDGSRKQNYLHVRDAALMFKTAGESNCRGAYNAVAPRSHSNKEVAELVAQLCGAKVVYENEDRSPSYEFSHSRWKEAFGVLPGISLQEGLSELVDANHG